MVTTVAKVTTSKGARLHLDNAGNAHCGAGNGRTIATTSKPLADANPDMLCRRCLPAIRAAADTEIRNAAGGGQSQYRTRSTQPLRNLRAEIRTPDEIRKAAEFAAKWEATKAAAPQWKPSKFAEMRAGYAHANDIHRDEQMALIAA